MSKGGLQRRRARAESTNGVRSDPARTEKRTWSPADTIATASALAAIVAAVAAWWGAWFSNRPAEMHADFPSIGLYEAKYLDWYVYVPAIFTNTGIRTAIVKNVSLVQERSILHQQFMPSTDLRPERVPDYPNPKAAADISEGFFTPFAVRGGESVSTFIAFMTFPSNHKVVYFPGDNLFTFVVEWNDGKTTQRFSVSHHVNLDKRVQGGFSLHYTDDSAALYAATANGTFNSYHLPPGSIITPASPSEKLREIEKSLQRP